MLSIVPNVSLKRKSFHRREYAITDDYMDEVCATVLRTIARGYHTIITHRAYLYLIRLVTFEGTAKDVAEQSSWVSHVVDFTKETVGALETTNEK